MKLPAMAGASPFAHLLGKNRAAAAAKAEDEKEREEAARAKDEKGDDANSESEKDEGEGEETGEEEETGRKSKKARGKAKADADDGDDEDETDAEDEDDEKKAEARGAAAMQARCEAIFASPHAAANVALAAQLAFRTRMSAKEAVGVMQAAAAAPAPAPKAGKGLHDRMAEVKTPVVGSDAAGGQPDIAAQIVAAGKKRRGEI